MKKNLYISDLDGTLLNNDAVLVDEIKNQINELIDNGSLFTIASARSYKTIKPILSGINFNIPIIEFNGGYITDFKTGEHITINNIDDNLINGIYDLIKMKNLEVLVSTYYSKKDELVYSGINNKGIEKYIYDREMQYKAKLNKISSLNDVLNHKVMCFTVIDEKAKIIELANELKKNFNDIVVEAWEDMYYKPWYWLSVHSKNSTKGNAIKKLIEITELDFNKLITFGDNINDIEMFKISDESYAVKNACEDLKEIASQIIASNNDNSVVKKIIEIEKGSFN